MDQVTEQQDRLKLLVDLIDNWEANHMSLYELAQWRKDHPCTLVATNGCFDVLHIGHIRFLKKARMMGTLLVVGLNSDESVRQLKGDSHPVFNQLERSEMLRSLIWVDKVFIFNEKRATKFLRALKPDIWAKGGDYTLETLDLREKQAVLDNGGQILIIPIQSDWSSSKVLNHNSNVGWVA